MTSTPQRRTYWQALHPEVAAHLVVAARLGDEARSLAWYQWYRREPTTEFEDLLRAAFSVSNSCEPAE